MSLGSESQGQAAGYVDVQGAQAYAENRHGIDGAVLLDPYFTAHIMAICSEGAAVADIGCGAAPWSIYAARWGAKAVRGFENSQQMLDQAEIALAQQDPEISGVIEVGYGTVKEIAAEDSSFDLALSINVGCALPSSDETQTLGGTLMDHFAEMRRVMKPGGYAVVTAPASLETVFTTYGDEENKVAQLREVVGRVATEAELRDAVGSNTDILRATISRGEDGFTLADERGALPLGSAVLRKIPGLVVPNYFHDQGEYQDAIIDAQLRVVNLDTPTLHETSYHEGTGLGWKYVTDNPFNIYLLSKPK